MILLLGTLLILTGVVATYLASPNQRVMSRQLSAPWINRSGLAAIAGGLAVIWQWSGPASGVFIAMALAMAGWTFVPLAVAWLDSGREDRT